MTIEATDAARLRLHVAPLLEREFVSACFLPVLTLPGAEDDAVATTDLCNSLLRLAPSPLERVQLLGQLAFRPGFLQMLWRALQVPLVDFAHTVGAVAAADPVVACLQLFLGGLAVLFFKIKGGHALSYLIFWQTAMATCS
jgi:hypothetical protein